MKKLLLIALLIVGCEEVLEPEDCAGVAGGTAVEDCAGVCGGDTTQEVCDECPSLVFDCAGICDGLAVVGGCDNVCGSIAELDECGVCDGNGIDIGKCDCDGNIEDCDGVCGGNSELDECNICGGDGKEYTSKYVCEDLYQCEEVYECNTVTNWVSLGLNSYCTNGCSNMNGNYCNYSGDCYFNNGFVSSCNNGSYCVTSEEQTTTECGYKTECGYVTECANEWGYYCP